MQDEALVLTSRKHIIKYCVPFSATEAVHEMFRQWAEGVFEP